MRLSALQAALARARPAPLARPARRPDARRVPARRSLRAAAPPLRDDARPRDRRHRHAARRHARELGRQGREERRRLRPRQALLRLARAGSARVERLALRLHPLPAAARTVVATRADWARAPPLAARAERRRHRRRTDASSSSRARSARVDAQARALGGERGRAVGRAARAAGDAARPRALGRRGRAARPARARASPTSASRASQPGARSPSASLEALCSPS